MCVYIPGVDYRKATVLNTAPLVDADIRMFRSLDMCCYLSYSLSIIYFLLIGINIQLHNILSAF